MKDELAKRVATIHAQAILTSVAKQDCPTDQKIALIEAVQKLVREDMKKEIGTYVFWQPPGCPYIVPLVGKIFAIICNFQFYVFQNRKYLIF